MAQTQTLQRRIRSVKNAGQITKALEVVAASRMRRIQDSVAKVRHYAELADSIMRRISTSQEAAHHPYFRPGVGKEKLYVVFTSDRGQAGAFNSNVFNMAHKSFLQDKAAGLRPSVIVFGRKGSSHFSHIDGIELAGAYEDIADVPEANVFAPALGAIRTGMAEGRFNSVQIIYTQFKSSLLQQAQQIQLLPITMDQTSQPDQTEKDEVPNKVYEFEPNTEAVLEESLRLYFEARLMAVRIESAASEHAMRMVAMGNAHRNASDLADDLTLELNTVRQAAITQEIAEIVGGASAIAQ
ncbi:MAG TPA: ATP synthase F1 subunit gamma [Candidatus Saccharimonadales bacterium]|nr:ATP synthase F1 subunit gamma [Candidatus Saccharimonadales bacterium]